MEDKKIKYTVEGFEKLKEEYDYLKNVRRQEVKVLLKEARSFGDLSENSEYDEARDQQAKVESRIAELEYLMKNMGKVLSGAQIYEAVWNEPAYSVERTVTVHIKNIRSKIEINPKDPQYLKVVYGLGYKMEKI